MTKPSATVESCFHHGGRIIKLWAQPGEVHTADDILIGFASVLIAFTVATKAMAYYLNSEAHLDPGPIYVRENGQLHMVSLALDGVKNSLQKPRPFRLFPKGFSVELCMNREDDTAQKEKTDHFIFTYTREGNLRYSAKSLFSLVLGFISDNVDHIDSLIGFPEQIAEKLFSAAEARQKFTEPGAGLRALQKFTEAYGSLVLCSLCLRNRWVFSLASEYFSGCLSCQAPAGA